MTYRAGLHRAGCRSAGVWTHPVLCQFLPATRPLRCLCLCCWDRTQSLCSTWLAVLTLWVQCGTCHLCLQLLMVMCLHCRRRAQPPLQPLAPIPHPTGLLRQVLPLCAAADGHVFALQVQVQGPAPSQPLAPRPHPLGLVKPARQAWPRAALSRWRRRHPACSCATCHARCDCCSSRCLLGCCRPSALRRLVHRSST